MTATVARVFGPWGGKTGPVHAEQPAPHADLGWCGVRAQFRHRHADGTAADVTCPKCLVALRQGRPRAWKRS